MLPPRRSDTSVVRAHFRPQRGLTLQVLSGDSGLPTIFTILRENAIGLRNENTNAGNRSRE